VHITASTKIFFVVAEITSRQVHPYSTFPRDFVPRQIRASICIMCTVGIGQPQSSPVEQCFIRSTWDKNDRMHARSLME
jgi:hypothetical protein